MDKLEFRTLYANEIDCRVATIKNNGLSLLLYKDARVDQNILDETVGAYNWQRHHSRDNANCTISIWDDDKKQWIEKEDTGTESFTEKEKGLASDSFKRAGFNWGIGRELYTAPFIWISDKDCTIKPNGNKYTCYDSFKVGSISYDDCKNIIGLTIINNKTGKVVFRLSSTSSAPKATALEEKYVASLTAMLKEKGVSEKSMLACYKVQGLEDMTFEQYTDAMSRLEIRPNAEEAKAEATA